MAETGAVDKGETGADEAAKRPARARRTPRRKVNEELVRSYFDALAARDLERMREHWSPDYVQDTVPLRVFRGPDEAGAMFRELFAAVPDLETTLIRVVADEEHAVAEWRMAGTFSGEPFQGIDPNGRRVELRGVDVFTVAGGKLASETAYYDGMAFARGVGMLPPLDSGAERAMKNAFNAVTRVRRAVNERMGGGR